jgi:uncharacterized protein DUF4919
MLRNKDGILFGVANKRSIAWATAQAMHDAVANLTILLVITCACGAIGAQVPDSKQQPREPKKLSFDEDTSVYHQLVQRAKSNDQTVDFVKLRDAFGEWLCGDKVNTDAPNRDAMIQAFESKNYAKAVELIEVVLNYEFVNRGLHLAAEDAYRQLGNQTKADFHKTIAHKLLHAVLASGNGKTAETAYRVLDVSEEYFVMRELGYGAHGQALLSQGNKHYDLLMGTDGDSGKDVKVYFDISIFFGGCERVKQSKQE